MTPKEQFNIVIKCIEEMVKGKKNEETGFVEYYSYGEIDEKAFKDVPISPATRDKNAIFAFLTKKTLPQYIAERRMMAAYQYLINKERFTINEEIAITNLSSQASFNKKFKTFFPDMTPKDAYEKKDASRIIPPSTWEDISEEHSEWLSNIEREHTKQDMKFGVAKEQYLKIKKAQDLQALYELNDNQSDLAFNLCDTLERDLPETFEYVYQYAQQCSSESIIPDDKRNVLCEILQNEYVVYLYFLRDYNFKQIINVLSRVECGNTYLGKDIYHCDKMYLLGISALPENAYHRHISKRKYDEAYQYFMDKSNGQSTEKNYIKYLALIFAKGYSCKEAFKMMNQEDDASPQSLGGIMFEMEEDAIGFFADDFDDYHPDEIDYHEGIITSPEYDSDGYDMESGVDDYEREAAYLFDHEPSDEYLEREEAARAAELYRESVEEERVEQERYLLDEYAREKESMTQELEHDIDDKLSLAFLTSEMEEFYFHDDAGVAQLSQLQTVAYKGPELYLGLVAWGMLNCIKYINSCGKTCTSDLLMDVYARLDWNAFYNRLRWHTDQDLWNYDRACNIHSKSTGNDFVFDGDMDDINYSLLLHWLADNQYITEQKDCYSLNNDISGFWKEYTHEAAITLVRAVHGNYAVNKYLHDDTEKYDVDVELPF